MDLSHVATAFGLGLVLGTSPGAVQLLLLAEASRSGAGRAFRAMLGANATFGLLLVLLALGLAAFEPSGVTLRAIRVVGGAFLIYLAIDALRQRRAPIEVRDATAARHPALRGMTAVLLNPGVYVFLATTASALLATAAREGGRVSAVATALALLAGVSIMDALTVGVGLGAGRLPDRVVAVVLDVAALALAALGVSLIAAGIAGA